MNEQNTKDEAHYKLLDDELKILHALETWGSSLFLAAIALVAKALIDWIQSSSTNLILKDVLHWPIYLLPYAIGYTAFVFLRAVNFRIRRVRATQYTLLKLSTYRRWGSFGIVGWLLALMPLSFGGACSYFFANNHSEINMWLQRITWCSGITILIALFIFIWVE